MKRYKIVTAHEGSLVADWYQKAVNDTQVNRFLTGSDYFNTEGPEKTSWEYMFVMDNNHRGLMYLKADRSATRSVTLGLHVLSGPDQSFAAGVLLQAAPHVAKHYMGGRYMEWNVHATNTKSLAASAAIGGKIWGRREEAMWDTELAIAVDSVHFRMKL